MADDFIASLPPEVRRAYQQSCEGMTPTAMREAFGLTSMEYGDADAEETSEFNPQTELGREARRLALNAMRDWEGVHRSHWSSVADSTVDKRAAFLRSAQHAQAVLGRTDEAHDQLLEAITDKAKHLATVLDNASRPPTTVGDAQIDAEVRAMIQREPNPDKAMSIARAHPRAVATLPAGVGALLVGESGFRTLRNAHLQAVAPDAMAEHAEVARALDVITKAHGQITKRARALIDFDTARQMAKHANWKPYEHAA